MIKEDYLEKVRQGLGEFAGQARFVGHKDKIPKNPRTGDNASPTDPATWGTLNDAFAAIGEFDLDGIGIVLGEGLCGIDLDHCKDAKSVQDWALEIVEKIDSYTEISPSGTGLHILFKGILPGENRKGKNIEIYSGKRYFTLTGDQFTLKNVEDRNEQAEFIYKQYFLSGNFSTSITIDDDDKIDKKIENGLEHDQGFKEIWFGKRKGHSESEDDFALMCKLAYWTDSDQDLMIESFRKSPFAALKDWEHRAKLAREDYLPRTAKAAIISLKHHPDTDESKTDVSANEEYKNDESFDFSKVSFINPLTSTASYTLDDIGNAKLFADTFRNWVLYIPEFRAWRIYHNGVWQNDKDNLIVQQCVKKMIDYIFDYRSQPKPENLIKWDMLKEHWKKARCCKSINSIIDLARDEMKKDAKDFDCQPYLINCKNGTFNLKTMQFQPHNSKDLISMQTNVIYKPAAKSERFDKFITEICDSVPNKAVMLQKALGYALKGEANEECFFLALGETTRNGKGTLFDTILFLLGDYAKQMDIKTLTKNSFKDGSQATPDLARLKGVRFVLTNEPSTGITLDESLIKQLTGSDDIVARGLHQSPIQFKPGFKIYMTANIKPSISDDSIFASERIKLLPFTRHFSDAERDPDLKSKFKDPLVLSAVLNWLLEGYRLYVSDGLKNTPEMDSFIQSYRLESNSVMMYLSDRIVSVPKEAKETITIKSLRDDYNYWCYEHHLKPLSLQLFQNELEKQGIHMVTKDHQNCIYAVFKDDA